MRPPPFAASLCEPRPRLPRADIEPPRALDRRQVPRRLAGADQFLAGKRRQADGADELGLPVAEHTEEIDQFRIDVVVGFRRIRAQVHQHGRGAAIDIAKMPRVARNVGKDEIQVTEFPPVPAEGDQAPRPPERTARRDPAPGSRRVDSGYLPVHS